MPIVERSPCAHCPLAFPQEQFCYMTHIRRGNMRWTLSINHQRRERERETIEEEREENPHLAKTKNLRRQLTSWFSRLYIHRHTHHTHKDTQTPKYKEKHFSFLHPKMGM